MIKYIFIVFLFFSLATFAQEDETIDEINREAPSELETSNKGIYINTSVGMGASLRTSNGKTILTKIAPSIPISASIEAGIARNFRLGLVLSRDGNRVSKGDSLRIYAVNYGLSMALRVSNSSNSFYYIRGNVGFSDLQISGASFVYGNIQDSIVMTSNNGVFVNFIAGQQVVMQEGVNFFYQAKLGYLYLPKLNRMNFITKDSEVVYSDNPPELLKLQYIQFFIEVGFTFKL